MSAALRCGHLLKSHPAFQFPGGAVALPPPSREELLLSAQQWVNAVSGELHELLACLDRGYAIERSDVSLAAMQRQLDHVKRILAELGGVL